MNPAMTYAMGLGHTPQDGRKLDYHDCHVWLVDENKNIIDPTPPAMEGQRHYKAFKYNQQKYFDYFWKRYKALPNRKNYIEELYAHPEDRQCPYNAIAYWKKHKNCKIVVGSLGFDIGRGRILWEFG